MNNHPKEERSAGHYPEPLTQPRKKKSDQRTDGLLRILMFIISLVSLGVAMLSMAYVGVHLLMLHTQRMLENIFPIVITIGLAYGVGWLVALYGIRFFHNLVLPIAIDVYAWLTLIGVNILYIAILYRLYEQKYPISSFAKYTFVMAAALAALIGFHLLIEDHSLRMFSIPLLLTALIHLYLIVYHYVFAASTNYTYLLGDILFFIGMATVSVLMLVHAGILNGIRETINRLFEDKEKENKYYAEETRKET